MASGTPIFWIREAARSPRVIPCSIKSSLVSGEASMGRSGTSATSSFAAFSSDAAIVFSDGASADTGSAVPLAFCSAASHPAMPRAPRRSASRYMRSFIIFSFYQKAMILDWQVIAENCQQQYYACHASHLSSKREPPRQGRLSFQVFFTPFYIFSQNGRCV